MKEFFQKIWEFIKKFWYVLIIPIVGILVKLFVKDKDIKKDIKGIKKDIKEEVKDANSAKKDVEKIESKVEDKISDIKDIVNQDKKQKIDSSIEDILPGIK